MVLEMKTEGCRSLTATNPYCPVTQYWPHLPIYQNFKHYKTGNFSSSSNQNQILDLILNPFNWNRTYLIQFELETTES